MQCLNLTGKSLSVIFALTSLPVVALDAAGKVGEAAPYRAKALAMAE